MENTVQKDHVKQIFDAAVEAVQPANIIPHVLNIRDGRFQVGEDLLPFEHFENIYVAGAGKATAAMAYEVEKILGTHLTEGVIAVRDVVDVPLKYTRTIVGGHPLPDRNSVVAAEEIVKLLGKLKKHDLLIFLLSGGASSLMMDIPEGLFLPDVILVLDRLMKRGATIHELNVVRKHLSELKGGQLVKKCSGAMVVAFIMSDVIGNDPQLIGSGPTTGDESTFEDAMGILEKYDLRKDAPYSILSYLEKGINKTIPANPSPGDPVFKHTRNNIIADNRKALNAAKEKAGELGYEAHIITDSLSGFAEEAAKEWVSKASSLRRKKICMIAGGETTVKVKGTGKGGRSQQFALTAAVALKNSSEITLLAAGTDGSDGPTDAAGAFADSNTYARAKEQGLDAQAFLENNDAYHFFERTGDLLKTGPTNTNVMDVIVTVIG
ncbi:MAG: glycerate kinase [Chitinophagaceae bacterium]|nr:glycerate kinase [Chitinophagaceae bacterium]